MGPCLFLFFLKLWTEGKVLQVDWTVDVLWIHMSALKEQFGLCGGASCITQLCIFQRCKPEFFIISYVNSKNVDNTLYVVVVCMIQMSS